MKNLNYVFLATGMMGVFIGVLVSPDFATRYLSSDHNLTYSGMQSLQVYRLLALRGGAFLLALGATFLLLELTSLRTRGSDNLARRDVITLAVAAAVIATLVGYRYGSGDHIEQLPIVKRTLDSSYLSKDFFTNASAVFGPRYYFAHLVALLARVLPLPVVCLALTLLGNALLAVISGLFARDLFNDSNLAGLLAVCLVMSVDTFRLGASDSLSTDYLLPGTLAWPVALLSLWSGFRQRPVVLSVSAGLASLVHPLIGLETGVVALFALGAAWALAARREENPFADTVDWVPMLGAAFLLLAFAALSLVPYQTAAGAIQSARFVSIVAYFRHPHHYCPSTFGRLDYLQLVLFLVALGISWHWWRERAPDGYRHNQMPILVGTILALCVGGYVFVELVPSRLFTTAQIFRLVGLVKWLGLIWISGTIASLLRKGDQFDAYLLLISVVSPITVGVAFLAKWARKWVKTASLSLSRFFAPGPVLVLVVASMALLSEPSPEEALLFLTFVFMAVSANAHWRNRWQATELVVLATAVWVFVLFGGALQVPPLRGKLPGFEPVIRLSDLEGPNIDSAQWARRNTPQDAVFLSPPSFGQFRLIAERAIVVDFKAFPFQDEAMLEWQQRLFDCYGVPAARGFAAAQEMDADFRAISDATIRALQSKYGISYAILYSDTPTRFSTLYDNRSYKIVGVE
ncbi:MAG: hypothetical protein PVH41_04035 [Anaerolineae bacterium]|jgi:hypothetical protein